MDKNKYHTEHNTRLGFYDVLIFNILKFKKKVKLNFKMFMKTSLIL